jgi:hypothetical protein
MLHGRLAREEDVKEMDGWNELRLVCKLKRETTGFVRKNFGNNLHP